MTTQLAFISTMTPTTLLGLAVLIRLLISWRRFNRRGLAGLQHYPNFLTAIVTQFIEWALRWAANGVIVYALFKILFARG